MLDQSYFSLFKSFINESKHAANQVWQAAKTLFDNQPISLWQQAQDEPGYRGYQAFCAQLNNGQQPEKIISPYTLFSNKSTHPHIKAALKQQLQQQPEKMILRVWYEELLNSLIDVSAGFITEDQFAEMLDFYRPYVDEAIYEQIISEINFDHTGANREANIIAIKNHINRVYKNLPWVFAREEENGIEETAKTEDLAWQQLVTIGAACLLMSKEACLSIAGLNYLVGQAKAAFPTVANPIPTQYAQPGQSFNLDVDLNYVFNDVDGGDMTYAGVSIQTGPSLSWLGSGIKRVYGRDYENNAGCMKIYNNTVMYTTYDNNNYQETTTSQGCITRTTNTDRTDIYIGVGSAIGVVAIAAVAAVGIFACKRRAMNKQIKEDISSLGENELETVSPEASAERSSHNPK